MSLADIGWCAIWAATIYATWQALTLNVVGVLKGLSPSLAKVAHLHEIAAAILWAVLVVFWFN